MQLCDYRGWGVASMMASFKSWIVALTFLVFLITMSLLTGRQLLGTYQFLFDTFSIEPNWVSSNTENISSVGHVVGYFFLAVLCRISTSLCYLRIATLCISLDALLEVSQNMLSYRHGCWEDFWLGVGGVLFGFVVCVVLNELISVAERGLCRRSQSRCRQVWTTER